MLDCKICNNEEIMQSYCNADFSKFYFKLFSRFCTKQS